MPNYSLIPVTLISAFLCGSCLTILGSIKLALARRLGIGEGRVGLLLGALNLALIPMMLASGMLVDEIGVEWVLMSGALLAALAVACLAMSLTFRAALASTLFLGAGIAGVSTSCSVLMLHAFFPLNMPAAAALNLGNVFFGLGALVTALLANAFVQRFGYQQSLLLLALCCLAPVAAAFATPREAFYLPRHGNLSDVILDSRIWLAGLVFLLYGPLENILGTWATTYLTNLGFRERQAFGLLAGFWLTFLASRFLAALLQRWGFARLGFSDGAGAALIVGLALLAGVILGNMAGTSSRSSAGWCLLLVGLVLGPIFPTLAGIVLDQFPNEPGTAFGTMFAIGGTGSMILAPVIGIYVRKSRVQQTLWILMVAALLLAAAGLVLGLTS